MRLRSRRKYGLCQDFILFIYLFIDPGLSPAVSQDDDSTDMFIDAIQNDKLHQMERNL